MSTGHQSLDQQTDALTAAGVDPVRIYRDKLSGTSTNEQRPGLTALFDYARPGDVIVVVGIDRLGRNAAEVMLTIRDLGERGIVLRSLRGVLDELAAVTPRGRTRCAAGASSTPAVVHVRILRSGPGAYYVSLGWSVLQGMSTEFRDSLSRRSELVYFETKWAATP